MSSEGWKRRLLSNALWVSLGILLGRVAGFVRETSLAAEFGASNAADIAVALLTIPDLFVNLLVGGALSVALIPEFKRLGVGPRSQALFIQGSILTGTAFLLVAALASFFAPTLLGVLVPGLSIPVRDEAADLLGIALWVIPLTTLAGVSTAYLQAQDRFVVPALGTAIYNGLLILAILGLVGGPQPLFPLAVSIVLAAFVRWLSQLARLPRYPFAVRVLRWPLLRRDLFVHYVQALGAAGFVTLLPVIARAMASNQGEGAMALFNYAHKLVEFPLGVAISVLSVVIFPLLSQAFSRGEDPTPVIGSSFRWMLALSLAILVPLLLFGDVATRWAFGWGQMTPEALHQLTRLFSIGLWYLPLQGFSSLLLAIFNARRDTGTPLRINTLAVILFLPIAWFLGRVFGLEGVMLGLVATYALILILQLWLLQRRHAIAVWRLLQGGQVVRLLVAVGGLTALTAWGRMGLEAESLWLIPMALFSGLALLVVGLFALGEGQFLSRRFTERKV